MLGFKFIYYVWAVSIDFLFFGELGGRLWNIILFPRDQR